jgi:hypothetical protein
MKGMMCFIFFVLMSYSQIMIVCVYEILIAYNFRLDNLKATFYAYSGIAAKNLYLVSTQVNIISIRFCNYPFVSLIQNRSTVYDYIPR